MRDERLGYGYVLKSGCSKGVRFIDNADSDGSRAVPALVLDSRKAVFYDCIPLMELVEELWNGGTEPIELLRSARRFDDFQQYISRHLKDVKVKCNTQINKILCISQLSTRPVGQLRYFFVLFIFIVY
ncbi:unnamed protein product [Anisakis simplex]|uniref:FCP1 homology domain-containing protein n=1 Tax=Anisakis simplex TaxID=6269 RepID=A0A0M3JLE7_ANISI|nr:unnamed protein product [Anisakis simplex]